MQKKQLSSAAAGAAVAALTLGVYASTLRNQFVTGGDEDVNIINNLHIHSLNMEFVKWAFTDVSMSYWQPLSWFVHAIDYVAWGVNPFGHHLTSVLLHAGVAGLVTMFVISLLTSASAVNSRFGASPVSGGTFILIAGGVTGVLFGIHPLQTEAVASAAGIPDLLCALFYLASCMAYLRYATAGASKIDAEHRDGRRGTWYLVSLAFAGLALGSKPMAVMLPFVFLILDWYPLNRLTSRRKMLSAVGEKLPFTAISLAAALVTYWGERVRVIVTPLPLGEKLLLAARALMIYLRELILPLRFSPTLFPLDAISLGSADYFIPVVAVCSITAVCAMSARKWLMAIWGYYVITLLPVLGIIRVRAAVVGDRYTYLPGIGLFLVFGLAAAWMWSWSYARTRHGAQIRKITIFSFLAIAVLLSFRTQIQISRWENGLAFMTYVIERETQSVPWAYHNRGLAYAKMGRYDKAIEDYTTSIRMRPDSALTFVNRGLAFREQGLISRAMEDLNAAIALDPGCANAYTGRGLLYSEHGRPDLAMADYDKAIALDPDRDVAYNDRGMMYQNQGRLEAAIGDFSAAIALNPFSSQAYVNRGIAYERVGRFDLASDDYAAALAADASCDSAHNNRGLILERAGRLEEALADFDAAVRLNPSVVAYTNRGLVYEDMGQYEKAVEDYNRAIELDPGDYLTYENRAIVFGKMGMNEKATDDRRKAAALKR